MSKLHRGENPVWDDDVVRTHLHRCKAPAKPSAHELRELRAYLRTQ